MSRFPGPHTRAASHELRVISTAPFHSRAVVGVSLETEAMTFPLAKISILIIGKDDKAWAAVLSLTGSFAK